MFCSQLSNGRNRVIDLSNRAFGSVFKGRAGLTPVYIEEITAADKLVAGASASPVDVQFELGHRASPNVTTSLSTSYFWYSRKAETLFGFGVGGHYQSPNVFNSRFSVVLGLTRKSVLGARITTTGTGLGLGFSYPVAPKFDLYAKYKYLSFSGVASTYGAGEKEAISAVQFGASYSWM